MSGPWERFAPTPADDGPWSKFVAPKPSGGVAATAKDVGASFGSGLARGVAETAMLPVTVPRLLRQGLDAAVEFADGKVRGVLGMPQLSEAEQVKRRSANTGNDIIGGALNAGQDAARQAMDATLYAPQTTAGKYARTVGEFIPGALLPGATVGNAMRFGVVPGLASEAAGQATEGTAFEPWARAGAGVAAGLGMAALQRPGSGQQALEQMAGGPIPRQQIEAADALMKEAAQRGIQLTPVEALNQVSGGAYTRLAGAQRIVEQSQGGGPTMGAFMAERPGQVSRAGSQAMNQLAPSPMPADRLGIAAQDAADGAITTARQMRTKAVQPFYQQAAGDVVAPERIQGVIQQLDDIIASDVTGQLTGAARQLRSQLIAQEATPPVPAQRAPITDPRTGNLIRYETTPGIEGSPAVPRTNVGELNDAYKAARDNFAGPLPLGATATERNAGRLAGRALGALDTELQAASPALQQGRQLYGQISDNIIRPFEAGPVGAISQTDDVARQTAALFPPNPAAASSPRIGQAVREMAKQNPKAATDLVGNHARTVFAEATQNNVPGGNQFGGAKFAAQIAGNAEQAASLEAAVRALPGGDAKWAGFRRFLDVLESTGKRLPAGSPTSMNTQFTEQLQAGAMAGRAASTGGAGIFREIARRWDIYQLSRNTDAMADLLTSRNASGVFGRLSKENGVTPAAQALTIKLLSIAGQGARELERPKTQPVPQIRQ